MRSSVIFLILFLFCCRLGLAELVEVKFNCEPADCQVQLRNQKQEWDDLGTADKPLQFEAEKISLFRFSAPGYLPREETLARQSFKSGTWPSSGSYQLEPDLTTRLQSYLSLFGLVALLGVPVGLLIRKQVKDKKAAQERIAFLEKLQSEADKTRDSVLGQRLGKYLLTAFLGKGGMAAVYRGIAGKDLKTGEQVAVKVLSAVEQEHSIARFRREVQICQKLIHPNIVSLHDWGEDGELIYLVMELVEGGSLEEYLENGVSYQEALRIFDEALAGMEFAHGQGVTHRDLKPDNIMLTKNGRVKIADFGLAKLQNIKTVTVTGTVMGTPTYMAPEQIRDQDPDPSMDQYALGVLGFYLFTGRLPFESEDIMAVITKHLMEDPPHPRTIKDDLPEALCEILLRMLKKEPKERFEDLGAVRRELGVARGLPG